MSSQHVSCLRTEKMSEALTNMVIEDTIPLEPDLMYNAYSIKIFEQQDHQILLSSME
jgi:hypothetical protein